MGIENIVPGKSRKPTEEEADLAEESMTSSQRESTWSRERVLKDLLIEGRKVGLTEDEVKEELESLNYKKMPGSHAESSIAFSLQGHQISLSNNHAGDSYKTPQKYSEIESIDGFSVGYSANLAQNVHKINEKFRNFFDVLRRLKLREFQAKEAFETELTGDHARREREAHEGADRHESAARFLQKLAG